MPFAWYEPDVPSEYTHAGTKAAEMYDAELRDRALLLLRLGYSKEEITLRLRGNVLWDFELHAEPAHLKRLTAIVDKVYSMRSTGAGGPPSVEG
jgi:hypothetical protein